MGSPFTGDGLRPVMPNVIRGIEIEKLYYYEKLLFYQAYAKNVRVPSKPLPYIKPWKEITPFTFFKLETQNSNSRSTSKTILIISTTTKINCF